MGAVAMYIYSRQLITGRGNINNLGLQWCGYPLPPLALVYKLGTRDFIMADGWTQKPTADPFDSANGLVAL